MTAEDTFLRRLRTSPGECPKRLAHEVGISGRAARRLVSQLEAEGVLRSRVRGRLLLGGALVAGAFGLAAWALPRSDMATSALPPKAVSVEALKTERDLYTALDQQDAGRVEEARGQLKSDEEVLRLAALRYLAGLALTAHVQELLPLLEDPSERVRSVAIQMVGAMPGPEVEGGLLRVLTGTDRSLAERMLAVGRLKERTSSEPDRLAASLLPVLLDDSQVIRDETSTLLAKLTGKQATATGSGPEALHQGWREALGVAE